MVCNISTILGSHKGAIFGSLVAGFLLSAFSGISESGEKQESTAQTELAEKGQNGTYFLRVKLNRGGESAENRTNEANAFEAISTQPFTLASSYVKPSGNRSFEGDSIAKQLGEGANNNGVDGISLFEVARPKFSKGDTVVISFGTNDAGYLLGASEAKIQAWAEGYGDYAEAIREQGGNPMVLDIRHATGVYTDNKDVWNKPGYVDLHNKTVTDMNVALSTAMEKRGITFLKTNGSIEISSDNLHPSDIGAEQLLNLIERAERQFYGPDYAFSPAP